MNQRLPIELVNLIIRPHAAIARFVCRSWVVTQAILSDFWVVDSPSCVVKWAFDNGWQPDSEDVSAAIQRGRVETLKLLHAKSAGWPHNYSVAMAAQFGQVEILKCMAENDIGSWSFCVERVDHKHLTVASCVGAFESAASHGQVATLEWLANNKLADDPANDPAYSSVARLIAIRAAAHNQRESIAWMCERWPWITDTSDVCHMAAISDHLELLKWLRDPSARSDGSVFQWNYGVAIYARGSCRAWVNTIKW
jgi:hypothetical protein